MKERKAAFLAAWIQWRRFTDKKVGSVLLSIERPQRVSSVEVEIGGRIPCRLPAVGPTFLIGTVRVRVVHSCGGKAGFIGFSL